MRNESKLTIASLFLALQACGGGGGGDSASSNDGTSSGGEMTVAVLQCTDGVTEFMSGDEINKTDTPTVLRMTYAEDGSKSGCVVAGSAVVSR